MDNSDGLASSLDTIAKANSLSFFLELQDEQLSDSVREVAARLGIDAMRLVFGWGDWQLVTSIAPDGLELARRKVEATGEVLHVLGSVTNGPPGVHAVYNGKNGTLNVPDSERFVPDSWFTSGLEAYITRLLGDPFLR
jgi:thiamine monophosphate kinase